MLQAKLDPTRLPMQASYIRPVLGVLLLLSTLGVAISPALQVATVQVGLVMSGLVLLGRLFAHDPTAAVELLKRVKAAGGRH